MTLNPYHLKSELNQLEKRFQSANKQLLTQSHQLHTITTENSLLKHKILELTKRPVSEIEIELKNAFLTIEKLQNDVLKLKLQLSNQNQNRQILEKIDSLKVENWSGNQKFIINLYQRQLSINEDLSEQNADLQVKIRALEIDIRTLNRQQTSQKQPETTPITLVSHPETIYNQDKDDQNLVKIELKSTKSELQEVKAIGQKQYAIIREIDLALAQFNESQFIRTDHGTAPQQVKELIRRHLNFINEVEQLKNEVQEAKNAYFGSQNSLQHEKIFASRANERNQARISKCNSIIESLEESLKKLRIENGTRKCEGFGMMHQLAKLKEQLGVGVQ